MIQAYELGDWDIMAAETFDSFCLVKVLKCAVEVIGGWEKAFYSAKTMHFIR